MEQGGGWNLARVFLDFVDEATQNGTEMSMVSTGRGTASGPCSTLCSDVSVQQG